MVLLIFLYPITTISYAVGAENSENINFGFYDDDPTYLIENITVSGFLETSQTTPYIAWSIFDYHSTNYLVDTGYIELVTSVDTLENNINSMFYWEINLDISKYSSCTCYLNVETGLDSHLNIQKPIFIIDDLSIMSPEQIRPSLLIDSPKNGMLFTETIPITGEAWNYNQSMPNISWSLMKTTSLEGQLSCQLSIEDIGIESNNLIPNIVKNNTNNILTNINISDLFDGFYSLYLWSHNENLLLDTDTNNILVQEIYSNLICISLKIDSTKPYALVNYVDNLPSEDTNIYYNEDVIILEGSETYYFDGSISDDSFWGRSGLSFVWTLLRETNVYNSDEKYYAPIDIISENNVNIYSLETDYAGNCILKLTVTDSSGNSNTTSVNIIILNLIPIAKLNINDIEVIDGEKIILVNGEEITIDATGSTDTTNDLNNLKCLWKVNNVPYYEGCNRKFSWPDDIYGDNFILTLEVIDDDAVSSEISIIISSGNTDNNPFLMILFLLFSIVFVSYALYNRFNILEDKIPKW